MSRNLKFAEGEHYHVYNRGTDKRKIFSSRKDYERFIVLLYLANDQSLVHISNYQGSTLIEMLATSQDNPLVDIEAYCLMPNHFHLLLHEKTESGISIFMHKLSTAYTMYFNRKYNRSGNLFQGRFKAKHASNDNYLKYLLAYIHLNPIKLIDKDWKTNGITNRKKALEFLKNYKFSSFDEYLKSKRLEGKIVNTNSLPKYFEQEASFDMLIEYWLNYNSEI